MSIKLFILQKFILFRKKYFNICQSLSIASNPFGFMETESLIAFDNCVPNNNLSLFREKSDLYLPLIVIPNNLHVFDIFSLCPYIMQYIIKTISLKPKIGFVDLKTLKKDFKDTKRRNKYNIGT